MPEEKKTVDIDTSGPEVDVTIEEKKDEAVIETEAPKEEATKQETEKEETVKEIKKEQHIKKQIENSVCQSYQR